MNNPHSLSARSFLVALVAAAATGCSGAAALDDRHDSDEPVATTEEALMIWSSELPNASCEKNILGNVICVQCQPGPFPSCKTYVCDSNGKNCKQTSRVRTIGGVVVAPVGSAVLAP